MRVFEENLPIENETMLTATEMNLSPITAALNGGEDYELLMTFDQKDFDKIKDIAEITPIGFVTADRAAYLALNSGDLALIQAQGWSHLNQ